MSPFATGIITGIITGIPCGVIGNIIYARLKKKPSAPYVNISMNSETTKIEGTIPNSKYSRSTINALQSSLKHNNEPITE